MSKQAHIKAAAEAHTNLTMWAAIQALCEGSLFYGASKDHDEVRNVRDIAAHERAKWFERYEAAIAKAGGVA